MSNVNEGSPLVSQHALPDIRLLHVSVWLILSSSLSLSLSFFTFPCLFAPSFHHFPSLWIVFHTVYSCLPSITPPFFSVSYLFSPLFSVPEKLPQYLNLKAVLTPLKMVRHWNMLREPDARVRVELGKWREEWDWSRKCKSSWMFDHSCLDSFFHICATAMHGSYLWHCVSKASFWVMKNK